MLGTKTKMVHLNLGKIFLLNTFKNTNNTNTNTNNNNNTKTNDSTPTSQCWPAYTARAQAKLHCTQRSININAHRGIALDTVLGGKESKCRWVEAGHLVRRRKKHVNAVMALNEGLEVRIVLYGICREGPRQDDHPSWWGNHFPILNARWGNHFPVPYSIPMYGQIPDTVKHTVNQRDAFN